MFTPAPTCAPHTSPLHVDIPLAMYFRQTAVGPGEARSLVPHVQITASRRLLGHDKMLPVVSFAVLSGVCDCEGTS